MSIALGRFHKLCVFCEGHRNPLAQLIGPAELHGGMQHLEMNQAVRLVARR